MLTSQKIVITTTAIIGVIAAVLLVLIILISKRLTPTHLYINKAASMYLVLQYVNPIFGHVYMDGIFPGRSNILALTTFTVLLLGIITLLLLLLLMDYFQFIREHRFVVIGLHAAFLASIGLVYYFVVGSYRWLESVGLKIDLFSLLIFALIFLLHRDIEYLKKRQQTDEESRLRYLLILVFFVVNVSSYLFLCLADIVKREFEIWLYLFSFGLVLMQPLFFLIVIFTADHKLRSNFANLFKMRSPGRSEKMQFSDLLAGNERLQNQNE